MCYLCNEGILSIHNLESKVIKRNQNNTSSNLEEKDTNKEFAFIDIKHLIMSQQEVNTRINLARKERTLRLYISPGNESISENDRNETYALTRMGYSEHLSGKVGWYKVIDITALQKI